jgi:peptide/nickel transport system substrate-binding protein
VQYLLFDGAGSWPGAALPLPGTASLATAPRTGAAIAALGTGANSIEFAVISRRVALPSFASHVFATVPARTAARNGGPR